MTLGMGIDTLRGACHDRFWQRQRVLHCTTVQLTYTDCSETDSSETQCSETYCSEIDCSETQCSETHCSETHCSETHRSETHCSETARGWTCVGTTASLILDFWGWYWYLVVIYTVVYICLSTSLHGHGVSENSDIQRNLYYHFPTSGPSNRENGGMAVVWMKAVTLQGHADASDERRFHVERAYQSQDTLIRYLSPRVYTSSFLLIFSIVWSLKCQKIVKKCIIVFLDAWRYFVYTDVK